MTTLHVPTPARSTRGRTPTAAAPGRDRSIDLIRSASLVLVVLLHAMMVGVTVSDGDPVFENALETDWFGPVSWFVQMMPLFFFAGGFTAFGSWRRARARGVSASAFVAGRVLRLMAPAVALFVVIAAGLAALTLAGVPADIVATAGFRISQPLWFLGVFLLAQALVPAMAAWHERRPAIALATLAAAAAAIDVVRFATGWEAIGFLNLAVVWLFVQQLGFWDADGLVSRIPRRVRIGGALGLLGGMIVLVATTPYVANMYANQDPPTLLLALLAVVQVALFSLARPHLARFVQRDGVARVVDWIGSRAMTIYLWHMTVLIALAGLSVLGAFSGQIVLPELHSAQWWLTRPAWLVAAVIAVALLSAVTARFEQKPMPRASADAWRAVPAAALGVGCVVIVFVVGLTWVTAAVCAGLAALAIALAGDIPTGKTRGFVIPRSSSSGDAGGVEAEDGVRA
ncbi:acyltransferase family protein [Microbacterium halotolerans]|uniref:acyltransferase family protein n=1 Tax=Microbacterium halotolerans TaxID=246613 RepID=UPI0013C30DB5|nr:acyltransferase [Microbacterium halotolerans]